LDFEKYRTSVLLNDILSCHQLEVVPPRRVAALWTVARAEATTEVATVAVEVNEGGNRPRLVWGKAEVALLIT
jgi:hypothetical protein